MRKSKHGLFGVLLAILTVMNSWVISAAWASDIGCQSLTTAGCCVHQDGGSCAGDGAASTQATTSCGCHLACGASCSHCVQALAGIISSAEHSLYSRPPFTATQDLIASLEALSRLYRPPRLQG